MRVHTGLHIFLPHVYQCVTNRMCDVSVLRRVGLVVSVSVSHAVGCGLAPEPAHSKDHQKMVQTTSLHGMHVLG